MKEEKHLQYAEQIIGALGELLQEGSGDWNIDVDELGDEGNLTHFMHALANIASAHIYNELTGDNKNQLDFNHVANKLCFQYMNKVDK